MRDVAQAADVSIKTVSNVINDHPNIKAETRERVLLAIEKLGYQPNLSARACGPDARMSSASSSRI